MEPTEEPGHVLTQEAVERALAHLEGWDEGRECVFQFGGRTYIGPDYGELVERAYREFFEEFEGR